MKRSGAGTPLFFENSTTTQISQFCPRCAPWQTQAGNAFLGMGRQRQLLLGFLTDRGRSICVGARRRRRPGVRSEGTGWHHSLPGEAKRSSNIHPSAGGGRTACSGEERHTGFRKEQTQSGSKGELVQHTHTHTPPSSHKTSVKRNLFQHNRSDAHQYYVFKVWEKNLPKSPPPNGCYSLCCWNSCLLHSLLRGLESLFPKNRWFDLAQGRKKHQRRALIHTLLAKNLSWYLSLPLTIKQC